VRNGLVTPLVAAVLGGGVTAGILLLTGAVQTDALRTVAAAGPQAAASPAARRAGELTVNGIYRKAAPGVVFVRARSVSTGAGPFDVTPRDQAGTSTGSGFVLDADGHLLTAAHVIVGATDLQVTVPGRRAPVPARVVGKDEDTDIALLRVDPDKVDLHPLQLGASSSVQVGDSVFAISNPYGYDRTLRADVVSARQRRLTAASGFDIENVIQTDAALTAGGAGSPLLDVDGRVVGVTSQLAGSTGAAVGFAVPIDTVRRIVPALLGRRHKVIRPWLGIEARSVGGADGVVVQRVYAGGPAERAGVRDGAGGDVLEAVGGKPVRSAEDVTAIVRGHRPGDALELRLVRDGRPHAVRVTLAERPATLPLG
jgi:S1-C subfamily serine protease